MSTKEIKHKVMSSNKFDRPSNYPEHPLLDRINEYIHQNTAPVVLKVEGTKPELSSLDMALSKEEKHLAFDKTDPIIAMHKSELVRLLTTFINYYADDYSQVTNKQIDRRLDEYFNNKT